MAARKFRVLISGLGIAGSALAWWLTRQGFRVTVVERAPALRTGGYMIDFWGPGYEVAERMGLVEALRAVSYPIERLSLVGKSGQPFATLNAKALTQALNDRFFSLLRSDLVSVLYRAIQSDVDIRFGDQVQLLASRDKAVDVVFEHSRSATFDLVLGADGLHSPIRSRLFDMRCEHPLGFWAASFSIEGYSRRDDGAYVSFTQVGRQVARYSLCQNRTAFLFVFRRTAKDPAPLGIDEQKAYLRRRYGSGGWECPEILARLDDAEDFYFDQVAQVRAPRWSKGRIALVGDAAYAPSLLAGEGASLAMAGAMVLAGELGRARGNHDEAFLRYERHLRPAIERKQHGAHALGSWFAPRTSLGLLARNGLTRIAAAPALTRWLVGPLVSDTFSLPHYQVS